MTLIKTPLSPAITDKISGLQLELEQLLAEVLEHVDRNKPLSTASSSADSF